MQLRKKFTKENLVNTIKKLKKLSALRFTVSYETALTSIILILIFFIAFTVRMLPLKWEIQTGGLHLSEFDPYFQYRFTEYIVKHGYISWAWPEPWIDTQRWYPQGINVAKAGFPGLPFTAAFFYQLVTFLGAPIKLMDFCAVFPAVMGALACIAIFFLGRDIAGTPAGLISALVLALSPSYITRTSLGFFDDETIGIFALIVFMFLFLRAIDTDRPFTSSMGYSLAAGAFLGYFCSGWGASLYPIGVTTLFVFLLLLLKRYSQKLLFTFSLTFGLGLFIAINVPKLAPKFLTTWAILPVAGVFSLLCLSEVLRRTKTTKWKLVYFVSFFGLIIAGFAALWALGYMGGLAGKFTSVLNPFARLESPLIESVAEHRVTAWGTIYYEFGIGIAFFAAGLYFIVGNLTNRNLFLLVYGITGLYFACSMVRLVVLLSPAFSLILAVGVVGILKPFVTLVKSPPKLPSKRRYGIERVGREYGGTVIFLTFIVLMATFAFPSPRVFSQAAAPVTITAASIPTRGDKPITEWIDALTWMRDNLPPNAVVCSWWDYGYWITVVANRTSLADNATVNKTQIQNIGFIYMSNETEAIKMLKKYDADYILVFTVFNQEGKWHPQLSFGDEGKWMWMARISGQRYGWNETEFGSYNNETNQWEWNERGKNTMIYKLMTYGRHEWSKKNLAGGIPSGEEPVTLKYFKPVRLFGIENTLSDNPYGGIFPMICLYQVDWEAYYHDYPNG